MVSLRFVISFNYLTSFGFDDIYDLINDIASL